MDKKNCIERKVPLDTDIDWLLRGVPQTDGGTKVEPEESWEGQEFALAKAREDAAAEASRIEEAEAAELARREDEAQD